MSHVSFVAMSGFRVREAEMGALGMALPGLRDRAAAIAALPPLGILTLAALTPEPWSTSLHEAPFASPDLIVSILAEQPTLVAVSALTASVMEAYALSDTLRKEGLATVLGGLHATAMPDEALLHFDAVVVGDGEPVWTRVLDDARAGVLRGLYRPDRPFDLARSPVPRFDLLGAAPRSRFTVQTQRGCPLACDFCAASRLLGPHRSKPIENVARELLAIGVRAHRPIVELADDNTFVGRRDVDALLTVLGSSGVRWFTECDWRVGERPGLAARMARAGCVQALVGIESMVHEHSGMGAKSADRTRMTEAIERMQEAGIAVIACAIFGSDGEDLESLHRLMEFLEHSPFSDVQLTLLTPFPGTALRSRLLAEGRILPDRDWRSYTLFDLTFAPDRLSVEQMERGFRTLVRGVFSAGSTARREAIRRDIWAKHPRLGGSPPAI